jgi:hypothetical protein
VRGLWASRNHWSKHVVLGCLGALGVDIINRQALGYFATTPSGRRCVLLPVG